MKFDLKTPCKNCPFRTDETAIRFSGIERAKEIEESAYRRGFPCHLSAKVQDEESFEGAGDDGYYADENTQHCAGYTIMQLKSDTGIGWPGIDNDDDLAEKLSLQMDMNAPVFENADEFFEANMEVA